MVVESPHFIADNQNFNPNVGTVHSALPPMSPTSSAGGQTPKNQWRSPRVRVEIPKDREKVSKSQSLMSFQSETSDAKESDLKQAGRQTSDFSEGSVGGSYAGGTRGIAHANSSVSGTSQSSAGKRGVWIRLVFMDILPMAMVLAMSIIELQTLHKNWTDSQVLTVLTGYATLINSLTDAVLQERSDTHLWMKAIGNMTGEDGQQILQKRYADVDSTAAGFLDYLSTEMDALPKSALGPVGVCRNFIDYLGPQRNLISKGKEDPEIVFSWYTKGIQGCLQFLSALHQRSTNADMAIRLNSIPHFLRVVHDAAEKESMILAELHANNYAVGAVSAGTIQQLYVVTQVRQRVFNGAATLLNADDIKAAESTPAALNVIAFEDFLFDTQNDKLTLAQWIYYFTNWNIWMNELKALVLKLQTESSLQATEALDRSYVLFIALTAVAVACPVFGLLVGIVMAGSIATPFNQLRVLKTELQCGKMLLMQQAEAVSRFVPYESLQLLGVEDITSLSAGQNSLKRLTVMFVSVTGFEKYASRVNPEESFKFLNEILSGAIPIIQANKGIVDKLMGDKFMVFFSNADKSLKAAIQMFQWTEQRNAKCLVTGREPIRFTIGLNTGDVCVGTIGTLDRMDTTTIGDAVNVAARICSCAKATMYNTNLLITGPTVALLHKTKPALRLLGPTVVKGRPRPVDVYEVLEVLSKDVQAKREMTKSLFTPGQKAFAEENYEEALPLLEQVVKLDPKDAAAAYFIQWIREGPIEFKK